MLSQPAQRALREGNMRLHAAAALALAVTCADAAGITEVTTRTFEAENKQGRPAPLGLLCTVVRPLPTTGTDAAPARRF